MPETSSGTQSEKSTQSTQTNTYSPIKKLNSIVTSHHLNLMESPRRLINLIETNILTEFDKLPDKLRNDNIIIQAKKFFQYLAESFATIINKDVTYIQDQLKLFTRNSNLRVKREQNRVNMQKEFMGKLSTYLKNEQITRRGTGIEMINSNDFLRRFGNVIGYNRFTRRRGTRRGTGIENGRGNGRGTIRNDGYTANNNNSNGGSPQISHIKIFQSEFKKILIKLDNISEDISLSVSNKNKKIKKVIKEYKKITLKHIKILKKEQLKLSSKKKIIKRPKKSIKKSTKKQMKKSTKKQMKKSTKKQMKKSTKKTTKKK